MANLINSVSLEGWVHKNVTLLDNSFVLNNGSMYSFVSSIQGADRSRKYSLSFNCTSLTSNSFLLLNCTSNSEKSTYMIPVVFSGQQEITIETGYLDNVKFSIVGSMTIRDIVLSAYFDVLTEEEKNALIRVNENGDKWDVISEITDGLGNVVADKIQGAMHLNKVNIQNSTGNFIQNDNNMMWVSKDGTFASLWNDTGIYFAYTKDQFGEWIWNNAIGANGVVATKVVAEALSGLSVEAMEILGGIITGGTVRGVTIEGSTVMAGNIEMTGAITWNASSSPVTSQYSIDGVSNWHNIFADGDKFARYTYDGGKSWTTAIKLVGDKGDQGIQGDQGESYKVEVISSNGSIFKNGNISTVLSGIVYRNGIDVTDTINASAFRWIKVNADGSLDEEWNIEHFGGSKTITITTEHVKSRATFLCEVEI